MNIQEAKAILSEERVNLGQNQENIREWREQYNRKEEAEKFLVAETYTHPVMTRIIKLADVLGEHDQEAGYEEAYTKASEKAQKIMNAQTLKVELKIKALQQELTELASFNYEVRRGDFSCLRIGLIHEIQDNDKKVLFR